ncbi:hypothetical protein Clacol_003688 [Clathrus columnatus]|uniref:Chalcone isomerase domain-containing protein n=1 Tax=Clathrus columnatus TaxID=1419009 RepID=A0AAV5A5A0_9AGAM|nr:hypothetical protein Clacol_003688 [Clathrus columnatus]
MFRLLAFRSLRLTSTRCSVAGRIPIYALTVAGTGIAVSLKPTIFLDASTSIDLVRDIATDIEFPAVLRIPSRFPLPEYTLLGVGVRKVSFFGIKVYSVAFYADLTKIPPLDALTTTEEKVTQIIRNTSCVIRIVPTRSTSYSHLRDGFMRALQGRLTSQKRQHLITDQEENLLVTPMLKFKSLFPSTAIEKHAPLDVISLPPTNSQEARLIIRDLGSVTSTWLAREFILAYFEGEGISPPVG